MRQIGLAVVVWGICITACFVLLIPAAGSAATLIWDASSGTVDGYTVHYGTSSGNPSSSLDVGNTTRYDLNNLPLSEGVTYYLCVSAYNTAGESQPCAPVAFTPGDNTPPLPPMGLLAE